VVGAAVWLIVGIRIQLSLTFGLLNRRADSPTDPIAVFSTIKNARAPKNLETKISGESLFNERIAVVVFSPFLLAVKAIQLLVVHRMTFTRQQRRNRR
jgi:monovalent cation:H+ antiporter, CPA1 family